MSLSPTVGNRNANFVQKCQKCQICVIYENLKCSTVLGNRVTTKITILDLCEQLSK